MIVVSNSSPLILLSKLGHFDLLRRLFNQIVVSQDVWDEVVVRGAGRPGAAEMQQANWIRVATLSNPAQLAVWQTQHNLGVGELSTILLALDLSADVSLIDERRARLLAQAQGVAVLGVVGALQLGYRSGEISDLRQAYQDLLTQGAHIDKRLINRSLAACNLPPL